MYNRWAEAENTFASARLCRYGGKYGKSKRVRSTASNQCFAVRIRNRVLF